MFKWPAVHDAQALASTKHQQTDRHQGALASSQ
jgi:hypothetical protein